MTSTNLSINLFCILRLARFAQRSIDGSQRVLSSPKAKKKTQYAADLPTTCFSDTTLQLNLSTDTAGHVQHITTQADGVSKGCVYISKRFCHSALHVENDNLASVNYMHKGEPKYWLGFSADSADQIDRIARETTGMKCNKG